MGGISPVSAHEHVDVHGHGGEHGGEHAPPKDHFYKHIFYPCGRHVEAVTLFQLQNGLWFLLLHLHQGGTEFV